MSYVSKYLVANERVVSTTRLHPIVILPSGLLLLFSLLFVLASSDEVRPVALIVFAFALLRTTAAVLTYVYSEFAVTTGRVMIKVGVVRRRSLEVVLRKVESMAIEEGLAGRLFGYGTLIVTGTGGSREVFPNVENPQLIRTAVQTALGDFPPVVEATAAR